MSDKICRECRMKKSISDFSLIKKGFLHIGYKNICRKCVAEYAKRWREQKKRSSKAEFLNLTF